MNKKKIEKIIKRGKTIDGTAYLNTEKAIDSVKTGYAIQKITGLSLEEAFFKSVGFEE